jgi:putative transposase
MSTKRKTYSAEFKAKVVLEVLEAELTLNQIASKYELLPANVKNWKKMFLENISLAFDKSAVVKEYKDKIEVLQSSNDNLAKKVGNLTVEKDFLVEKLQSLVLKDIPYLFRSKTRKKFVDTKHKLSLNHQCKLLHIAKSTLYYSPVKKFSSEWDIKFLNELNEIHSVPRGHFLASSRQFPYYGTRRLVTALENEGFSVGRKLLKSAMEYIGIKALYPKHKTMQAYKEHYKYH